MKAEQHVEQPKTMENSEKPSVKSVDSNLFDYFKKLTSTEDKDRINGSLQLLQHLAKSQDKEKKVKEIEYSLKRLIRGVGASTNASRAGFFTTLVEFLKYAYGEWIDAATILKIIKKELHVGNSVSNKEDADAVVGQILVCGALVHSQKIFGEASSETLVEITRMLTALSRHRTYHNALAYSFVAEILQSVDENQFASIIWPVVESELKRPWDQQNINTLNCLITAVIRFPNVFTKKYLKSHFGGHSLLNPESFKHVHKIFWENTSVSVLVHPSYENFAKYAANSKHLITFWTEEVEQCLKNPTKMREMQTLKILADILANSGPNIEISKLLTENFLKLMVSSLKTMKQKKDETLSAFYNEFFEALSKFCAKLEDDGEKVKVIHKLVLHPGNLGIEKYTPERIIHQIIAHLGEGGVQELWETYKNIFLGKLQKNPNNAEESWLNVERQNAGYMMQSLIGHKNVQAASDWRKEQLKFMMTYALFHINEKGEIVSKKEDDSDGAITNDFAMQLKNIFYASLQSKVSRLKNERKVLLSLAKCCNEILEKKHYNKYLRNRIDEKIQKAWLEMYAEVQNIKKKEGSEDTLRLVFHILLLQMGLQLFREPEMAEAAILDLEKCMEKTKQSAQSKQSKTKDPKEGDAEQEPEWIEVVVDLFLHLLSQNNSALRHVVNSVFPHLCNSLTLTAMHQILSVLDMSNGNNPLSDENETLEEDIEEDDNESKSGKSDESEVESDDNEEDEDDDEEEIMEEEEEECTDADKLRSAVTTALGSVGIDPDQESIDLDDMDEEEGKKLDEALSEAFKLLKRPVQGKKSKEHRVKTTTVMHFRIRVLDLIDIYLQQNPSLLTTLEIMISLYNMIEFCGDGELKPLCSKVEKVLTKLTALRHFSSTEDVEESNICDFLRLVIEKKVRAPVFDVFNKLRVKCTVFLIACGKILGGAEEEISSSILSILCVYLNDFIKSRNPTVNITLLSDIFKMRWKGVWHLATHLSKNGLLEHVRTFRRMQVLGLLDLLYKNHEVIRLDTKIASKTLGIIESNLQKYITWLAEMKQISVREFTTILDLLFTANRCHTKIPIQRQFDKEILCNSVQNIRKKIRLENCHSYNRICSIFGVKVIKNSEVVKPSAVVLVNGTSEIVSDDETKAADAKSNSQKQNSHSPSSKRKNNAAVDPRKQKKLRKEERMRIASEGLNGGISFGYPPVEVEMSDGGTNNDIGTD